MTPPDPRAATARPNSSLYAGTGLVMLMNLSWPGALAANERSTPRSVSKPSRVVRSPFTGKTSYGLLSWSSLLFGVMLTRQPEGRTMLITGGGPVNPRMKQRRNPAVQ